MLSHILSSTLMELHNAVVIALGVFGIYIWQCLRSSRRRLPPGPRGLPFIGNVSSIPRQYSWNYYTELKPKYGLFLKNVLSLSALTLLSIGDLVYLSAMGQHIILLNSYKVAYDLLVQRAAIYSDRPRAVMVGEM